VKRADLSVIGEDPV